MRLPSVCDRPATGKPGVLHTNNADTTISLHVKSIQCAMQLYTTRHMRGAAAVLSSPRVRVAWPPALACVPVQLLLASWHMDQHSF
jgi:hypothetical protein